MFATIQRLKQHGYTPNTILDVGGYNGNWTNQCSQIYPDAKYYIFEPIHYSSLENISRATIHHVILAENKKEVDWYEGRNSGDSVFKELTHYYTDVQPQKRFTDTIDNILKNESIGRVFIKADIQGSEIPMLKGALNILQSTDFILLEMPVFGKYNIGVPTFLEHVQFLDEIGFIPYEISETRYAHGFNIQTDIMFINKNHSFASLVQKKLMEK